MTHPLKCVVEELGFVSAEQSLPGTSSCSKGPGLDSHCCIKQNQEVYSSKLCSILGGSLCLLPTLFISDWLMIVFRCLKHTRSWEPKSVLNKKLNQGLFVLVLGDLLCSPAWPWTCAVINASSFKCCWGITVMRHHRRLWNNDFLLLLFLPFFFPLSVPGAWIQVPSPGSGAVCHMYFRSLHLLVASEYPLFGKDLVLSMSEELGPISLGAWLGWVC